MSQQTILVVDDDELLARMVAELLRRDGYQVWTAHDGLQGYSSYYQHQAQTVVTDIDMPELDGFEMMRCIRAINPAARVIYISGAERRDGGNHEGFPFTYMRIRTAYNKRSIKEENGL